MKKIHTIILTIAFSLQALVALAGNDGQTNSSNTGTIYYIDAPRFVRPLIEKWISEYKQVRPEANFAIAKTPAAKVNSILTIQLSDPKATKDNNKKIAYFGSYAILPITAKNSEVEKSLGNQELNAKKIKTIYFENEDLDEQDKKNKFNDIVVYSGNNNQSISQEFAAFYGKDASSFRGKRIVGDDQFLNSAISKDPQGITFNTLSNIYDLSSRKAKANIVILNPGYTKEEKVAINETNNIDNLLEVLENNKDTQIPVEKIGFAYLVTNIEATSFLSWILTQGEQYNHQFGLLRLDSKLVAQQAKSLPNRLTAQK